MTTVTRPLHPDERALLERWRSRLARPVRPVAKPVILLLLLAVGEGFLHLMSRQTYGGLFGLYGLMAAVVFAIVGYVPIAFFVTKSRRARKVRAIGVLLQKGTVTVTPVKTRKVALAMEHAREGDLWIIEYAPDQLLYLWDYAKKFRRTLPRAQFDLYDEPLLQHRIYPTDAKMLPTFIDSQAKFRYLSRHGAPGQMATVTAGFEDTVDHIGSFH